MPDQLSLFDEFDEVELRSVPAEVEIPIRVIEPPARAPRRDWFVLAQMVGCERAVVNAMIVGDVEAARGWLTLRAAHRDGMLSSEEFSTLYALAGEEEPAYTDWLKVEVPNG